MSSTLWIRNLQLGIYGLPLSIAYMYAKDHANLSNGGIMQVPCAALACPVLVAIATTLCCTVYIAQQFCAVVWCAPVIRHIDASVLYTA